MGRTWAGSLFAHFGWLLLIFATNAAGAEPSAPTPLRTLKGRHVTLITDLPADPSVEQLPAVFDQAVPLWRAYFNLAPRMTARWHVTAYVINNRQRFRQLGLLPDDLPPFEHGYQRGDQLWVYEQPSPYYRRHLLLHEGTHAFMFNQLGHAGPPWYTEGMAELFGTHRWHKQQLLMQILPASRDEVPYWGRIKLIRQRVDAGQLPALDQIVRGQIPARQTVEKYAWSWAAAIFLDQHPDFQQVYRRLPQAVALPQAEFAERLYRPLATRRAELERDWQLFLTHLDYGYDVAQEQLVRRPAVKLPPGGATVVVHANRAWQSSGLRLRASECYQLQANGRFQVADDGKAWPCEAGGVTIRYYQGRPLGQLLAAVVPAKFTGGATPLIAPQAVGLQHQITPPQDGILYLRINEGAGQLADNRGQLTVRVQPLPASETGPSPN